ncbi:hypothetical protein GA0004736_3424 [Curtobacterium sp. 9128]|uniref:hypothetical protein n=1 Tax=Curtobacterium sp. 9128 TaxID=1793722 RepID=UPI0007D7197D|nr:hypothetical protein [Curtobacterium sp. 9128]SBN64464.1 hypothetical protein GA0004736_3424 [Curtobacterium sp. 9128]
MARDSSGPKNEPQYAGTGVPQDAADLTEVARYAAMVGNRKVGASSDRQALTGADVWPGLEFYETDTGLAFVYQSSTAGWVPTVRPSVNVGFNDTTNSNGILVIRHGLGVIPNWIQLTMRNTGTDSVSSIFEGIVWDSPPTSTTSVQIRFRNSTNGAWLGNNKVVGYLAAGV